jgi:phosphatidylinositol-3-phosphatase
MRSGRSGHGWTMVRWSLLAFAVAGATVTGGARAASTGQPCGARTGPAPATFGHVVVIMDENESFGDIIGNTRAAPYLNHLAAQCGLATNYRSVTHPSHPNYMAVTGGISSVAGLIDAPSIFGQVRQSGGSWRAYQESMPRGCDRRSSAPYKAGHNPGISFVPIALDCRRWDVGWSDFTWDVAHDALPMYALITPNQCHNMHASCNPGQSAIRAGDSWLAGVIPQIIATPGYQAGRTVIFITWDEGSHGQSPAQRGENCLAAVHRSDESCHVPTLVLSAYVHPGTRSGTFFSHYSLLQTTERLLGLTPFIGHAGDATTTGMRAAFGL